MKKSFRGVLALLLGAVAVANAYTVTFYDFDGSQIAKTVVGDGKDAMPPSVSSHQGLTFKGWDGTYTNVKKDESVYADFDVDESVKFEFTVAGVNPVSDASLIKINSKPSDCFNVTTKLRSVYNAEYNYDIPNDPSDWNEKAFYQMVANITISCTEESKLTNIWKFLEKKSYRENTESLLKATVNGVDFNVYSRGGGEAGFLYALNKVQFNDYDGTDLGRVYVGSGKSATGPSPVHKGLVFTGWDYSIENVQYNKYVTATYKAKANPEYAFIVTPPKFGETASSTKITPPEGGCIEASLKKMTRGTENVDGIISEMGSYSLQFDINVLNGGACADDSLANILRILSYEANVTVNGSDAGVSYNASSVLSYLMNSVQFVDYNGTVLKQELVGFGLPATAPKVPVHEGLTFKEWSRNDFSDVRMDMTITAVYEPETLPEIAFTITGLEPGNSVEDVKVKTPNECFSVSEMTLEQSLDGEWSEVTGNLTETSGFVTMRVAVSDKGKCADDESVYAWKYYSSLLEGGEIYTVNGRKGKIQRSETRVFYYFHYVEFVDYDKTVLKQEYVGRGMFATAPDAPVHKDMIFKKWDSDFSNIERNMTITAVYEYELQSSSSNEVSSSSENAESSSSIEETSSSSYDVNEIPEIAFTVTGLEAGKKVEDIDVKTPNSCFSITEKILSQKSSDKVEGTILATGGSLLMPVSVSDTGACVNDELANIWRFFRNDNTGAEIYTVNGKKGRVISNYESRVMYLFDAKDVNPNSSSSVASSSSSSAKDAKSSSSKGGKESIFVHVQLPQFSLVAMGRDIQVAGARMGSAYAVFDMQGHVMVKGRVAAANFDVPVSRAGSYLVRIGNQVQKVNIK